MSREEGNWLTGVSMTASLEGRDEGSSGEHAGWDGQKSVHSKNIMDYLHKWFQGAVSEFISA